RTNTRANNANNSDSDRVAAGDDYISIKTEESKIETEDSSVTSNVAMTVSHFLSTRSASGVDKSKLMHLIKHLIYIHRHPQSLQRKAKANSTKNGLIKC
ncbi:hypothetical protein M5D96_010984, partial [Drosophila gunungcola]